jgi:hypothetical protein
VSIVGSDPFVALRFLRMKLIQHVGLAADIGLHVYDEPNAVPAGVNRFVLLTPVTAADFRTLNSGAKAWTDMLWQAEYWANTHDAAVMAAGDAMLNDALDLTSGTMSGSTYGDGDVWVCYRERPLTLPPEIDGNVTWRRAGGEYRCYVTATT